MIQRIQTLWLLVASMLNASLLYFDLYHSYAMITGTESVTYMRANDHYPTLLTVLVITILPFVTIFMFKNRKRQRSMLIFTISATIGFIGLIFMRVNSLSKLVPPPTGGSYWIGAVIPVISIVFLIMAYRGINKDEKLVKSLDRLR